MQTSLPQALLNTTAGKTAERILRNCVHCGFCTATCPTYQLLGDELDSPRGRIYLLKQFLEGATVTRKTQLHVDRCLTCRACESTCPSGVDYGQLIDIGREMLEKSVERPLHERLQRRLLRSVLPYPQRFAPLLRLGQLARPLLPTALRNKVPRRQNVPARQQGTLEGTPEGTQARRMLLLEGCAQSVATPATNAVLSRVLDRLGISIVASPAQGCCGAVDQHLGASEAARVFMRRNIDAWWPAIEAGAEAIISSASGCGVMVKDYAHLLAHDPAYARRASKVSALARDISEVLAGEDLSVLQPDTRRVVAYHAPCTLQHGQRLPGQVETLLVKLGFSLVPVAESHLCCGSAGTYSILQPKLSKQLLDRKLEHLQTGQPDVIATANVGCQLHLQSGSDLPVVHWLELLD